MATTNSPYENFHLFELLEELSLVERELDEIKLHINRHPDHVATFFPIGASKQLVERVSRVEKVYAEPKLLGFRFVFDGKQYYAPLGGTTGPDVDQGGADYVAHLLTHRLPKL